MTTEERSFLIVKEETNCFAFDLRYIREVCEPSLIWPVPFAAPCCRGAANVHGSIVAVMELAELLQLNRTQKTHKMVVLDYASAALALLVGQVMRIVRESEVQLQNPSDDGLSSASIVLPEGEVALLDVSTLIKAAERMMGADHYSAACTQQF